MKAPKLQFEDFWIIFAFLFIFAFLATHSRTDENIKMIRAGKIQQRIRDMGKAWKGLVCDDC